MQQSINTTGTTAGTTAGTGKQDFTLTDLWLVIRKRRWMLVLIALGTMLFFAGRGMYRGKEYTAHSEIQIQPGAQAGLKQGTGSLMPNATLDITIESDIRILTSDTLLLKVAKKLKLQDDPDFLGYEPALIPGVGHPKVSPLLHGNLDDVRMQIAVLGILRSRLMVTRIPRTQMLTIAYRSPSPRLATSVVNTLTSEFIEHNFITHYGSTQHVSEWLSSQIDDLRTVVQSSQDKMVDLQKRLGISALDPNHSMIVEEITGLQKNAAETSAARVLAEARYHILQSLPADQIQDAPMTAEMGSAGTQSLLAGLRAQRATASAELARLQPVYGPNYPQVKQLTAQVQSLDKEIAKQQSRVVAQARDAYNIAASAEGKARGALVDRTNQLYGQRDDLVQFELLSQEYESNRKMYESILARLREAAVDSGLDAADISVVDLAKIPLTPSSTSLKSQAMMGLFFGCLAGLALALIMERMDTRVRDARQIQDLLGLPSMAVVPQTNWREKTREAELAGQEQIGPEILWDSRSAFAEAVRVFRTSIQLSGNTRQSRVIALTSCQPGEGKSTLSTNLAAALAQGGKRVILVDTDMRRPSLLWRLKLAGKRGLSEYLTGNETLEAVTQKHKTLPTLDLISSGSNPPLPADLLSSETMKELAATLRERYDYVLFDTPPILSVTDPLIVSSLSDGLVMVIRQGICTRAMLHRASEVMRDVGIKLYGFVLNGVDASLPEYYGYMGYYSYDYKNREE